MCLKRIILVTKFSKIAKR